MNEPTEISAPRQLCLHCLAPNDVAADFCAQCRASLTSFAATAPLECAFAEGAVCRFAAERPRRLIVVLGIWLIFGMLMLFGVGRCAVEFSQSEPLVQKIIVSMFGLAMAAVSLAMIWKTTQNFIARNKAESPNAV
jgi:hypothetical protein